MSQNNYTLPDSPGGVYRAGDNDRAKAIASWNAGPGDPPEIIAYMQKLDLTAGLLVMRNAANNDWIPIADWDGSKLTWINTKIEGITALSAPAVADQLLLWDASEGGNRAITLPDLFKVTNAFPELLVLDTQQDFVAVWDQSAGAMRKAKAAALAGVFSKVYESPEQIVTSGGSLTLAHGLPSKPALYKSFLKFAVATGGYAIGEEVEVAAVQEGSSVEISRGVAVVPDAISLFCRYGNFSTVFITVRKDNGGLLAIQNADVRLIVRAWA